MNAQPDETPNTQSAAENPISPPTASQKPLAIHVVGIGGAGGNAIAHMATSDLRQLRLAAIHTSARILDMTSAPEKILIGKELTHGLGAGGDPSLARAAAERDLGVLRDLCQGVDLLFIVTGLGGGTGTGVAPVLARVGKESGALVVAVATLPFDLEGGRRRRLAEQGLEELKAAADAVICLPNQKIFQIVDENTSVLESLKITNELLAQGIRGIWQILTRPSLIHVDFADLASVLRDRHVESSFASVEAKGEGRGREVIEQLLGCPLLDGGQVLAEAEAVLVNLVGGPDLSMADVKRVMDEINRRLDNAQVIIGASVSDEFEGRIGLTLVAARRSAAPAHDGPVAPRPSPQNTIPLPSDAPSELENRLVDGTPSECGSSRFVPPPPQITLDLAEQLQARGGNGSGKRAKASLRRLRQGNLPLEIVSKGRFEKSHPTIHRGEDLDVPTYVRRGIPLN